MSTTALAANETRRQLRYNYTLEERNAKALEMAMALNRIDSTNAELDHIKADYKARLSAIESEENRLRGCVTSGFEMRDYLCFWTFDEPKAGRKTLRKREGGEVVAEEDMTERDRQMVMEIIEQQSANADVIPFLALPAPKEWPTDPTEVAIKKADALIGCGERPRVVTQEDATHFASDFFSIFCDDETNELRPKDEAEEWLENLLDSEITGDVEAWFQWLHCTPAVLSAPGSNYVITKTNAHLNDRAEKLRISLEAAKAEAAAAKKKSRAGRKANTSGTVDCAADEGSRDDAGADSKNNL
jgi:hypothetical protein